MAKPIKRCLIIDDDESFRQLITRYINLILPDTIVEDANQAVGGPPPLDFDWTGCDLVILDYFLNASLTGLDLLNEWKNQENFPPVIMMTAAGSEDIAVRAMKTGVQDYLRKQNLTREKLRQAIEDALKSHEKEHERRLANTQNNQSFNKALFYKKLEQPVEKGRPAPVFFLIELDQYIELGEDRGIIVQDSLLRHLAKITFDSFNDENYQASITRMSDATIGLLFNPQADTSLEQELKKLSDLLAGDAYEYEDELIPYTVSIGAVRLSDAGNSASDVIRSARTTCKKIREHGGNDYAIYQPEKTQSSAGVKKPAPAGDDQAKAATAKEQDKPASDRGRYSQPSSAPAPAVKDKPRPDTEKPAPAARPESGNPHHGNPHREPPIRNRQRQLHPKANPPAPNRQPHKQGRRCRKKTCWK
ncbi:MAG: response regulator [Gammaproteobacteria bacterium]|nr:response regulator [Gammaproteobacteria bacterium]